MQSNVGFIACKLRCHSVRNRRFNSLFSCLFFLKNIFQFLKIFLNHFRYSLVFRLMLFLKILDALAKDSSNQPLNICIELMPEFQNLNWNFLQKLDVVYQNEEKFFDLKEKLEIFLVYAHFREMLATYDLVHYHLADIICHHLKSSLLQDFLNSLVQLFELLRSLDIKCIKLIFHCAFNLIVYPILYLNSFTVKDGSCNRSRVDYKSFSVFNQDTMKRAQDFTLLTIIA